MAVGLDSTSLIKDFQAALGYSDVQMASFFGTGITVFREGKAGTQDLPSHAMAFILEQLDLIEVFNGASVSEVILALLTKRSRQKYLDIKIRSSFSNMELESLAMLSNKYKQN